ncbi:MAG TPA: cysteine desulfurase family protein [Acidimicrobiales bacterium]
MSRHYLDHASTSPPRPEAVAATSAWLERAGRGEVGDPGRIHNEGMQSRVALEAARDQVAALLGARSREVVFTSGATEAITAATWGAVRRAVDAGRTPHVVLAAVEHSAVRQSSAAFAEAFGGSVTVVGVDRVGRVDPDELLAAITSETALVHLQWGNHEVGTLQPVAEVAAACRERGVLVHVDAAQATGRVRLDLDGLGVDLASVSGHKFGGPPGTGALFVRRGLRVAPLLLGGDQERARRAGMEDLPGLVGLGAAAEAAGAELDSEEPRCRALTTRLAEGLTAVAGVEQLGDPDPSGRLPHLVCLAVEGVEPQGVLLGLDQRGIAAHSGSACASEGLEPSPVLEAMGVDAHRSLRVSVGWSTTTDDVEAAISALPDVVGRLRSLAG